MIGHESLLPAYQLQDRDSWYMLFATCMLVSLVSRFVIVLIRLDIHVVGWNCRLIGHESLYSGGQLEDDNPRYMCA